MNLTERYRQLTRDLGAAEAVATLRAIEDAVRRGRPEDEGPTIFAQELARARARGRARRRRRPELLVLTVGYSPEPLFLSLAYHRPEKIALLLERGLEASYLESLAELWTSCREVLSLPAFDDPRVLKRRVRGSPGEVFQTVRRLVEEHDGDRRRVVLDITGAKKTMIAGAFLAAGFLDLEASYVDFETYHQWLRRPDPSSCRTLPLRHPYELFRLRDEDRLEAAFDGRRYREAAELADELRQMAERPAVRRIVGVRESRRLSAELAALGALARAYGLWAEGFYRDARDLLAAFDGLALPPVVDLLGLVWPRQEDERKAILAALEEAKVFADPAVALAYFLDVLAWHDEAAIRARPRASFLRLYGAIESVIFYLFDVFVGRRPEVLAVMCDDGERLALLAERFPTDRRDRPIDWSAELRHGAITFFRQSSTAAARVLSRRSGAIMPLVDLSRLVGERAMEARSLVPRVRVRVSGAPISSGLYSRLFDGRRRGRRSLSRFQQLRHKAVHWLAPVPSDLAFELHAHYCEVLAELIPLAVDHLLAVHEGEGAAVRHVEIWRDRLLAAAAGGEVEGSRPLSLAAARRCLSGQAL